MDNEYEKQRLANIEKNRKLLQDLELNQASNAFRTATEKKKTTSAPSKSHKRKAPPSVKKEEEYVPRRTSSRLAGIPAESELAKRKAEQEEVAFKEAERVKRQRVSGALDLSDIVVPGREWDRTSNFFTNVKEEKYQRTFTDEDVKKTTDSDLKNMRKKMMGLKLHENFSPVDIKIVPERIYCMAFHPVTSKPLVFAGDKLGNLGIFDASNPLPNPDYDADEDDESDAIMPNISAFKLHTRTISTFHFEASTAETVYSASYDGSIRKLDLVKQKSDELFASDDEAEALHDDAAISGIDFFDPHTIYFSTLTGYVGRKDIRSPSPADIWQCHEKKIGGFSLNPRNTYLAATASLDRTVKIWDLRKIKGKGDDAVPHMIASHESRLSVSSAYWNSAGSVITTGYDDTIKVFNFAESKNWKQGHEEDDIQPDAVVKHNNQTGRWVTILRAQWQAVPTGPQKFCIGNMNRFVDVYSETGEQLAELGGDGITAVPAVAQFHPTQDWIAAGTASGKLCLWT